MKPRPIRRLVLRVLAVVAGVAALCVLLLAFGLFPQEWLRRIVESKLRTAIGERSRIGHLHLEPARLAASARDIHIEGPGYTLEAPSASVRLSLATLLGRTFGLKSLALDHAVITVVAT